MDDKGSAAAFGHGVDEGEEGIEIVIVIHTQSTLDRHGHMGRHSRAHVRDQARHQHGLMHQAGTEATRQNTIGRTAAVEVDFIKPGRRTNRRRGRQGVRLRPAQLHSNRMLALALREQLLAIALQDGVGMDHLGIEQCAGRTNTVKGPTVRVGPIDHRRDRKPRCGGGLHGHHDATAKMTGKMPMNSARTFLLTGTRSQLGVALGPKLRANGDTVVAVAREKVPSFAAEEWVLGRLPDVAIPLRAYDAIVSFGPMDALAAWLETLNAAPAGRVIASSSMSAVSKHAARFAEDRAIAQRLLAGEARLRAVCEQLGMPCLILRPTMIYGLGLDQNLSAVARGAMARRVFFAPTSEGLRQPVHAEDVAEAALRGTRVEPALDETIEIGGGERLTVREMFSRVHRSLPRATLHLPAPGFLLSILALFSKRFRGAVSRLNSDLTADNSRLQTALGVVPRAFRPDPATWPPV